VSFFRIPSPSGGAERAKKGRTAVRRVSGPVLMFCTPGLIFDGTEGVGSRFHILRAQTPFQRCVVCRVPISCLPRPFLFSAVPRALGPVLMFCSPRLVFGGTEGVRSRFNVLRVWTCFLWYRGCRVSLSYFTRSDSFAAVSSASGPYFMFCAPVLIFSSTEGIWSRFHVLLPGLIFGGTDGVGSCFNVLRARTHIRLYRQRPVRYSCYARPVLFSAVSRASGFFFMFCATGLVFGGTEGV
jgi:hypothetical protein